MYDSQIKTNYIKVFEVTYLFSFVTLLISTWLINIRNPFTDYVIFFYFFLFVIAKFTIDDTLYHIKKLSYFLIYFLQLITFSLFSTQASHIIVYLSLFGIFISIILIDGKKFLLFHIFSICAIIVFYLFVLNFNDTILFVISLPFFLLTALILRKINTIKQNRIDELSTTDDLTGLLNQSGFMKKIEEEYYRSQRYNKNFSVLMLDSDNLKVINDTYGHKYGSIVIVSIAETIKENIRRSDFAARYGGDEFIICLVETDLNGAVEVAERIRKQFELKSFFTKDDKKFMLTLSIGVSSYPICGDTLFDVLDSADRALYESKNSGKNKTSYLIKK